MKPNYQQEDEPITRDLGAKPPAAPPRPRLQRKNKMVNGKWEDITLRFIQVADRLRNPDEKL